MKKSLSQFLLKPNLIHLKISCFLLLLSLSVLVRSVSAVADGLEVEHRENIGSEVDSFFGVEKIFRNPILASGLASGTDSLNRSIDTLMEYLFYDLLDNDLVYRFDDQVTWAAGLKRDVYSTYEGSYVIVDRFQIGPRYQKPIAYVADLPINLGIDGSINVLSMSLRTDGMRLSDNDTLPYWRVVLNNWFGLLPLLTNILPPSFNPNELYDPISQIATPFEFLPLSIEALKKLKIGSIRSYSLSGGVNLGFNAGNKFLDSSTNALKQTEKMTLGLPYSIFVMGEYRINVLRKSENEAWVGLSDVNRIGNSLTGSWGRAYFVFSKIAPFWKGVPTPIIPVTLEKTLAKFVSLNQLYSFNLEKEGARLAYLSAVRGDFSLAEDEYKNSGSDSGVQFRHRKKRDGIESGDSRSNNFFVFYDSHQYLHTDAELNTTDPDGKFVTLESKVQIEDQSWNLLVGPKIVTFNNKVEIDVVKHQDEDEPASYLFAAKIENKYNVILSLNINDRFAEASRFKYYLNLVKDFTMLPLENIPNFPRRDKSELEEYHRKSIIADPSRDIMHIHVTPTQLGRLGIDSVLVFSQLNLMKISEQPEEFIWKAFARAYGIKEEVWAAEQRLRIGFQLLEPIKTVVASPGKWFGLDVKKLEAFKEVDRIVSSLLKLKNDKMSPLQTLKILNAIIKTEYPVELANALLNLLPLNEIPRSVSFSTKAHSDKLDEATNVFRSLNKKSIKSEVGFLEDSVRRTPKEEEYAFIPTEIRESRKKPEIATVELKAVESDDHYPLVKFELLLAVRVNEIRAPGKIRMFIRLEQDGKVNIGRFVILERVVLIQPQMIYEQNQGSVYYEVYLTGSNSEFRNLMYKNVMDYGGSFIITLSVSDDSEIWSEEKSVKFRWEKGQIDPS